MSGPWHELVTRPNYSGIYLEWQEWGAKLSVPQVTVKDGNAATLVIHNG